MMTRTLAVALAALALAACASAPKEPMGQVFAGRAGSTGAVVPLATALPAALHGDDEPIVILYNHGTDWGGQFQNCQPSTMPDFLKAWANKGLDGHRVVVVYLCTQVVEDWFAMGKARADENIDLLGRLAAGGVPPRNIFIVGHSGGASTALITAEKAPRMFNSAIVTAPGYGFAWLEQEGENYPWMKVEYDKWRSRLARAEDMSALVFLFEGDVYAPPADAQFLATLPEVEVVTIADSDPERPGLCVDEPEPHFYAWSACFRRNELPRVEDYILDRLAHRTWLP